MVFQELVRHKWTTKLKFPKAGDFLSWKYCPQTKESGDISVSGSGLDLLPMSSRENFEICSSS